MIVLDSSILVGIIIDQQESERLIDLLAALFASPIQPS